MERIVVFTLRLAELAFAAIVAGVNGEYLHSVQGVDSWVIGRSIYAEVVAGISLFFALIWLIPFSYSLTNWPLDVIISLCWWAAFGLLVDQNENSLCGGPFNWNNVALRGEDPCGKAKAVIAFSFLSALVWLLSALVSVFWVRRQTHKVERTRTRRWHRRSHV